MSWWGGQVGSQSALLAFVHCRRGKTTQEMETFSTQIVAILEEIKTESKARA